MKPQNRSILVALILWIGLPALRFFHFEDAFTWQEILASCFTGIASLLSIADLFIVNKALTRFAMGAWIMVIIMGFLVGFEMISLGIETDGATMVFYGVLSAATLSDALQYEKSKSKKE